MPRKERYYPGKTEADIRLTRSERRRCLPILFLGDGRLTLVPRFINLNPDHIEFCFGANSVKVVFTNNTMATLLEWLIPNNKFTIETILGTRKFSTHPDRRVLGLRGTCQSVLYIVFKKESLL